MRSTVATHPFRRLAGLATAAVVAATGLASVAGPAAGSAAATPVQAHRHGPTLPYLNPRLPTSRRVADLLKRMTLAEKVGQMTQAERGGIDADTAQITTLGLGSVLSGGGSVPTPNTPEAWADMVDRYQRAALDSRLHIPLIYGVDSVHGHGNLYGATVFPHNIGLGATRDPALVREAAHVTAAETRASGPQWTFAPCLCVARDDRWGRTYESFGETPQLVESMETAIDGFQGRPGHLDDADRVLATAKHFAGDGLTTYGTGSNGGSTGTYPIDQGVDQVSRATFARLALAPYVAAVKEHHVGSVMPSYSDVDWTEDGLGNPVNMHGNRARHRVAQGEAGLRRVRHLRLRGHPPHRPGIELRPPGRDRRRGGRGPVHGALRLRDLHQHPDGPRRGRHGADGAGRRRRLARAHGQVQLGLFEHPYTDRRNIDEIGSSAHRAVARTAVQESQVLLKNDHRALPLGSRRPVYVAGSNADNIGNQAGGWTLTWQGGSTTDIPGTTILDAIRGDARSVTFSEDASAPVPRGAVGVVVVGETPYSEGFRGRRRAAVGLRPRRQRPAAAGEDDGAERRRLRSRRHGVPRGGDVRRPRRLGSPGRHPAGAAGRDRRARGVVAAR